MMTEREEELLRQALISSSETVSVVLGGVEYTMGFPPPETITEIAEFDAERDEEMRRILLDEMNEADLDSHWRY